MSRRTLPTLASDEITVVMAGAQPIPSILPVFWFALVLSPSHRAHATGKYQCGHHPEHCGGTKYRAESAEYQRQEYLVAVDEEKMGTDLISR